MHIQRPTTLQRQGQSRHHRIHSLIRPIFIEFIKYLFQVLELKLEIINALKSIGNFWSHTTNWGYWQRTSRQINKMISVRDKC